MRLKAFNALRPQQDDVHLVACPPYDTMTTAEARSLADGNRWSFLHVLRPEIDLPPDADPHSDAAYDLAAANFARIVEAGKLTPEPAPSVYVYRQTMGPHTQSGVVACCHTDDYRENVIRRHERTRADKEADRVRHIEALAAHSGPVFLAYRRDPTIDALAAEAETRDPVLQLEVDGVYHRVWRVTDPDRLIDAFAAVPSAYIADGHHRCAAAARVAQSRRAAQPDGEQESNWFLAVLFPAEDLQILPYNRCVADLNGLSEAEFLVRVRERFRIAEMMVSPERLAPQQACMYLAGTWYGLSWDVAANTPAAEALDVSYLQQHLLGPVLGIDDPRKSPRIDFVGGIRGTEALTAQVDSGRAAVAFAMTPVAVEQMMAISDDGGIMPPKSTWFEPKLRSGLVVHRF